MFLPKNHLDFHAKIASVPSAIFVKRIKRFCATGVVLLRFL